MFRASTTHQILCGVALCAAACSSPDVSLGHAHRDVAPGPDSSAQTQTKEPTPSAMSSVADASTTPTEPPASAMPAEEPSPTEFPGSCSAPLQIASTDDAWLDVHWTSDAPPLPMSRCGFRGITPSASPAIAGRWVAPSAGMFFVSSWGRDFAGALVFARRCGDAENGGCMVLPPRDTDAGPAPELPDIPWKPGEGPERNGVGSETAAGEEWFFWLQSLDSAHVHEGSAVIHIEVESLPSDAGAL